MEITTAPTCTRLLQLPPPQILRGFPRPEPRRLHWTGGSLRIPPRFPGLTAPQAPGGYHFPGEGPGLQHSPSRARAPLEHGSLSKGRWARPEGVGRWGQSYPAGGDAVLQGQHGVPAPAHALAGLPRLFPLLLADPGGRTWSCPAGTGWEEPQGSSQAR